MHTCTVKTLEGSKEDTWQLTKSYHFGVKTARIRVLDIWIIVGFIQSENNFSALKNLASVGTCLPVQGSCYWFYFCIFKLPFLQRAQGGIYRSYPPFLLTTILSLGEWLVQGHLASWLSRDLNLDRLDPVPKPSYHNWLLRSLVFVIQVSWAWDLRCIMWF